MADLTRLREAYAAEMAAERADMEQQTPETCAALLDATNALFKIAREVAAQGDAAGGDYYVRTLDGHIRDRAHVLHRTSENDHALICACGEVSTAERIAAALNAQASAPAVAGVPEGWRNG